MSAVAAARRALGWRAAEQASVQAIYFVRILVLARLLVPEAFGLVAIAMLALSVLLSLSDLGVVPALVQRADADRDDYDAAWTIRLCRAALIAAALVVAAPVIAAMFGDERAAAVIRLLALRPVLEALGSIGVARLTREFRFRDLAFIQVPAALIDAGVAIALAGTLGVWALVAGSLAGAAGGSLLSYAVAPHRPRLLFGRRTAEPLVRFGGWVLATSVVGLIATSGIQLVISRELGVAELGLYFLATKVAFLPADAASHVAGTVAFPLYASMRHDEAGTAATLRSLLIAQALVLFPGYALVAALAPSLTEMLGAEWAGSAPLIQIISVAAVGGLYADTVLPLLMGRGRPDRVTMIIGAQTAVLFLALFPLIAWFGLIGVATAWVPAYAAALAASLAFVGREISRPLAGAGRRLLALFGVALATAAIAAVAQLWLHGAAALVAGGVLGVMCAGALLGALNRRMNLGIRELLSGRVAPVSLGSAVRV